MNFMNLNLDRDLSVSEREALGRLCHLQVVDWVCDAYVYPIALAVGFWSMMRIASILL